MSSVGAIAEMGSHHANEHSTAGPELPQLTAAVSFTLQPLFLEREFSERGLRRTGPCGEGRAPLRAAAPL